MTPEALALLHAAVFAVPRPWSAAEFASFLNDGLSFLLVEDGGFLLGRAVAGEAELLTLAVAPDRQRQGMGRRLVAGFLAEARRRGADQAFLEVAANNAPAITLYQGVGFVEAGKRRGYYAAADGRRIDALVFTQPLKDAAPVVCQ